MGYNFYFEVVIDHWDVFVKGALVAIELVAVAMVAGFLIGAGGAIARGSKNPVAYWLSTAYVELFRNTPLLVQLYLVYFGLPELGLPIDSTTAALIALSLNNGAYLTEIERAGIEAIHRGEIEAALSLGMSRLQVLRYVTLPRMFRIVFPAMASQMILIFLGTSLTALIAVPEITYQARILEGETFRAFEIYIGLGAMYVLGSLLMTVLAVVLGKKLFGVSVKLT